VRTRAKDDAERERQYGYRREFQHTGNLRPREMSLNPVQIRSVPRDVQRTTIPPLEEPFGFYK
jgi:hypothetical protein